jgi:hypothetical protein
MEGAMAQRVETGKKIGPHFPEELGSLAGRPFTWRPDGVFTFGDAMSQAEINQVLAIVAVHDPTRPATPPGNPLARQYDANELVRAVVLAITDRINQVRTQPTRELPPITPAQIRQAIIDKGTGVVKRAVRIEIAFGPPS